MTLEFCADVFAFSYAFVRIVASTRHGRRWHGCCTANRGDGVSGTEERNPNILLIEDDPALASMLSDTLRERRYGVWQVGSAADAEAALEQVRPDLILLDLMLPDRNGLIMCAQLKARAGAPVIICSATKRKEDAAIGLQLGADDFLRKPFSVDELQARIELTLRRQPTRGSEEPRSGDQIQRVGALSVDKTRCVVTVGGETLHLTPTEFRLLSALAGRPGEVLPRRQLAEDIWDCIDDGVLRSLDVHMRRLRGKLAAASADGPQLVMRRGFGYQLVEAMGVAASS
jgi:DNA-binding response OmpR family regulator